MTREEIQEALELHQKWLRNEEGGERATLAGEDLSRAMLDGINLMWADLTGVDFEEAHLFGANFEGADLRGANLRGASCGSANFAGADLNKANLKEAQLRGTNLRGADLRGADLRGADLWGANLKHADLDGADLTDVRNFPFPNLNILRNQTGKIKAFKLVGKNYEGRFKGGIKYEIGKVVKEDDYDSDERALCSRGLNIATLDWCLEDKGEDEIILEVEFKAEDIVAIPYATDGKFRLKRCKVIREVKEV